MVTATYTTAGDLQQISTPLATTPPSTGSAQYEYTDFGALKKITYGNGVSSEYTYDAAQRVDKIEHKSPGMTPTVIEKAQYVLDAAGNRTSKTDQSGTTAYTYDAANQLKQQPVPGGTAAYTYDNVGNRTVEVTPSGTTNHTYDGANRLVSSSGAFSATYTFDPAGRQTGKTVGGVTTTYGYDALDRLLGFSNGTTSASYLYNGDGLRVRKTVGSTVTNHIWDINLDVAQVLTDGAADYLWGPEGLIAGVTSAGGITYAQKDAQGTPQVLTTGTATPQQVAKYEAFGIPLPPGPPPGPTLPFGYTGEQTDAESGLVYLRARYMDPSTGRFLTLDPVAGSASSPGSQHGYTYAANNPARWTDPTGMFCIGPGGSITADVSTGDCPGGGGAVIGGMAAVRLLGRLGEQLAGIIKNTARIASLSGTARYRVPDYIDDAEGLLGEVKNVAHLRMTNQLRDFLTWSQQQGYRFEIIVRQGTTFDEELTDLIRRGVISIQAILPDGPHFIHAEFQLNSGEWMLEQAGG